MLNKDYGGRMKNGPPFFFDADRPWIIYKILKRLPLFWALVALRR
jgi:hypothetical protein